ncbi:hypothetical protein RRG08_063691 [Elysia crispata]|uniref:Uncharacterized protein n=1 Tax=Elysia crispata TaxID=231223 RepID=A0AAE0ZA97_9GAST|nr:hypothetical protein RRG08_063691 [Elysia crispata]
MSGLFRKFRVPSFLYQDYKIHHLSLCGTATHGTSDQLGCCPRLCSGGRPLGYPSTTRLRLEVADSSLGVSGCQLWVSTSQLALLYSA